MRTIPALIAALAIFLSACGGGSNGGGGLSEKSAERLTNQFVLDILGLLTGDVDAQRLIDSFAPECREGISASDINIAAGFISVFVPQLSEAEIEAVDLGRLSFERTDQGMLVTPEDPDGIRVKVGGQFVSANEFFRDLGFDESDDSVASPAEPLLIVERDGKAYIGDCEQLQDFGG